MNSWTETQFDSVVELQRGHDLPTPERAVGNIPVIGSFGITGYHNETRYQGPGIAIGRSGAAIGTATYVDGPFWPLNTCLFVRDFKGNCPLWIYYLLKSMDFAQFNSGSAQPSLNRNYLRDLTVLLPPAREQRAIAEVLGALDDKIAANEQLITLSEELAIAYASGATSSTEVKRIATHSTRSSSPDNFQETVAHYSLPAFDASAQPSIEPARSIKSNKFTLTIPSVLISKLNPRISRVWNVSEIGHIQAVASTEFVVLEPIGCSTSVLWSLLCQPEFMTYIASRVAGTSGSHQRVKPAEILSAPVGDPDSLNTNVRDLIDSLGRHIDSARKESQVLARTRDELLPLLMSGKLRVKDAEKKVEAIA
ncbi:restriction endonuclease subunit S [Nocardia salmonicida]|uniref:restriction endonuclease subunit S n=1 Tax=Nocardia salmonicida TaxID=53431 RepID=UPI003414AFBA